MDERKNGNREANQKAAVTLQMRGNEGLNEERRCANGEMQLL